MAGNARVTSTAQVQEPLLQLKFYLFSLSFLVHSFAG